jgi:hypothetical protein
LLAIFAYTWWSIWSFLFFNEIKSEKVLLKHPSTSRSMSQKVWYKHYKVGKYLRNNQIANLTQFIDTCWIPASAKKKVLHSIFKTRLLRKICKVSIRQINGTRAAIYWDTIYDINSNSQKMSIVRFCAIGTSPFSKRICKNSFVDN